MIPLKRCNYITGQPSDVSFAVQKILNFLEDDGRNPLFFSKPKSSSAKNTSLKYLVDNKFEFNNFEEFKSIITTDGNLFRVDLLIFDFWHLPIHLLIQYKSEIDKLNIDHIILAKEFHYKTSDSVNDYHVVSESKVDKFENNYLITDKISGWTSNLDDLSKSYIRDKKINQIIK